MRRIGVFASSAACAGKKLYVGIGIFAFLLMSLIGFAAADVTDDGQDNIRQHAGRDVMEYPSEQYKKDAATEWSNRTRFGGDMRLRAAGDRASSNNMQIAESASTATVNNVKTSSKREAVMSEQESVKDPVDTGIASLVELLKKKKVISAAEADRIVKQSASRRGGTAPDFEGVAALAALLESKKIIGADEAARFTKQYAVHNVEIKDNVRNEKMTAGVSEELRKDIQDQVRQQVHEELAGEDKVREKEKVENLDQNLSYLQQKVAEMLYGGKVGELAKESMPEWMKRFSLNGDIRLRFEHDRFDKNNFNESTILSQGTDTQILQNTWANTDRFKYRARLGIEAKVDEQLKAVIRLSTGNTTTPVSTNTLFGNFMNKDNILFDQAYLEFKPWQFLTVYGGRMPNPWFSSDLLWASDLNFEGFALTAKGPITESEAPLTPYLTFGAFPLQTSDPTFQNDFSQHGKWLYAGQIGLERKDLRGISAKVGAAYYLFRNITGVFNDSGKVGFTDWSAPGFTQKGNTLFYLDPNVDNNGNRTDFKFGLASEFKELNLTGTIDIGLWDPVHIGLLGDYVKNIGFNQAKINELTGSEIQKETTGYQIGMSVGYPKIEQFAQWKTYVYYKYLEANAVVDAFTDSDFHLGGTNAKGWILGVDFGLAKNTWLTLRWLTANEISGPPLAIDVLQLDLNAKF